MSETLDMIPLHDYQQQRQHVFPSLDSLRWFVRQNQTDLATRGALLLPARRLMVVPSKLDECVRDVGARRAAKGKDAA